VLYQVPCLCLFCLCLVDHGCHYYVSSSLRKSTHMDIESKLYIVDKLDDQLLLTLTLAVTKHCSFNLQSFNQCYLSGNILHPDHWLLLHDLLWWHSLCFTITSTALYLSVNTLSQPWRDQLAHRPAGGHARLKPWAVTTLQTVDTTPCLIKVDLTLTTFIFTITSANVGQLFRNIFHW